MKQIRRETNDLYELRLRQALSHLHPRAYPQIESSATTNSSPSFLSFSRSVRNGRMAPSPCRRPASRLAEKLLRAHRLELLLAALAAPRLENHFRLLHRCHEKSDMLAG